MIYFSVFDNSVIILISPERTSHYKALHTGALVQRNQHMKGEDLGVASVSSFCFSACSSLRLTSCQLSSDQRIRTEVSAGNMSLCAHLIPVLFKIKSTTVSDKRLLFMGDV